MITKDQILNALNYDPETGIFTRKSNGMIAGGLQSKGNGYSRIKISLNGKQYMAHRLAWTYMTGDAPPKEIDHIDRDATNNRWCNLRDASSENQRNKSKQRNNSSGVTGVSWSSVSGKWGVRIWADVNGVKKYVHLGLFESIKLAEVVAEKFRLENGYKEGHGKTAPKYLSGLI